MIWRLLIWTYHPVSLRVERSRSLGLLNPLKPRIGLGLEALSVLADMPTAFVKKRVCRIESACRALSSHRQEILVVGIPLRRLKPTAAAKDPNLEIAHGLRAVVTAECDESIRLHFLGNRRGNLSPRECDLAGLEGILDLGSERQQLESAVYKSPRPPDFAGDVSDRHAFGEDLQAAGFIERINIDTLQVFYDLTFDDFII